MEKVLGIGVMSGTSLDGIDTVLVELEASEKNVEAKVLDSLSQSYTEDVRSELMNLCSPSTASIQNITAMNMFLGNEFGRAVNQLLDQTSYTKEDIHFISSHGQTVYHQPYKGAETFNVPGTLQLGDLSVLSEATGIAVVGDFRTADMAVNGQGAPLVSYVDYLLFNNLDSARAIQNIGGIGNVTYIPKDAQSDRIQSFDTGPGNMVIDEVVYRVTGGNKHYDENGAMAYKGTINQELLNKLMDHEYIKKEPPKTTGRELFGKQFVDAIIEEYRNELPENLVATVSEWTVLSIVDSYKRFLEAKDLEIDEVIIGGGGSYNSYLLDRLRHQLPDIDVLTHESFQISGDFKEAMAFAVLGYQCIRGMYNQLPSATGADKPVIMGKIAYTQHDALERMETIRREF